MKNQDLQIIKNMLDDLVSFKYISCIQRAWRTDAYLSIIDQEEYYMFVFAINCYRYTFKIKSNYEFKYNVKVYSNSELHGMINHYKFYRKLSANPNFQECLNRTLDKNIKYL